jgi:hypothetical protein
MTAALSAQGRCRRHESFLSGAKLSSSALSLEDA